MPLVDLWCIVYKRARRTVQRLHMTALLEVVLLYKFPNEWEIYLGVTMSRTSMISALSNPEICPFLNSPIFGLIFVQTLKAISYLSKYFPSLSVVCPFWDIYVMVFWTYKQSLVGMASRSGCIESALRHKLPRQASAGYIFFGISIRDEHRNCQKVQWLTYIYMHTLGLRFTGTAKNVVPSTVAFSGITQESSKARNVGINQDC